MSNSGVAAHPNGKTNFLFSSSRQPLIDAIRSPDIASQQIRQRSLGGKDDRFAAR
jgi:hypothetical protein